MIDKKILLIEDEEVIRKMFRVIMNGKYEVINAENGLIGLEKYDTHRQELGLIVTDIEMPMMGGIEVITRIREYKDPLHIIAWSSNPEYQGKAIKAGADLFLSKPIDMHELKEAVDYYMTNGKWTTTNV